MNIGNNNLGGILFTLRINRRVVSIEPHLLDGEDVLAYCGTRAWIWICTDRRLLKYRQGSGTAEQLHDISFDEISAVSLVNTGRDDRLGGYGLLAGILGLVVIAVSEGWVGLVGLGLIVVAINLVYRWLNSERSYFEFRGSGLLRDEPEEWRIDESSADDADQVRELVRVVRAQL